VYARRQGTPPPYRRCAPPHTHILSFPVPSISHTPPHSEARVFAGTVGGRDQSEKRIELVEIGEAADVLHLGVEGESRLWANPGDGAKQADDARRLALTAMDAQFAHDQRQAAGLFAQRVQRDRQIIRARPRLRTQRLKADDEGARPMPVDRVFRHRESVVLQMAFDAVFQPREVRTAEGLIPCPQFFLRLIELGLVVRETPYGEAEKSTKRSLYKIADPFFRFWFQVVAPRRALLAQASKEVRLALWRAQKERLCGMAWEQLCRAYVGRNAHPLKALLGSPDDAWKPAMRWWRGQEPEFDVVAGCLSGRSLLIGEAKWSSRAFHAVEINRITESLKLKKVPASLQGECQYVAFLPSVTKHAEGGGITIVTADHVLETRE